MSVLKYFKTTPGRPMGATGPKCNFFLQICNEVHGKKKQRGLSPTPTGDRGLSPTPGATASQHTVHLPKRATEISKSQQELADWLVSNVVSISSVR